MSFLHPGLFLAGLVAIGLPVLIHLLTRRRRKSVRWGAMRFLMEAYRRQRRRLRLEQFLLLLTRCALVGLIGIGLARPIFGAASDGRLGSRTVVLVVDNSLGSSTVDSNGVSDLDRSKARAAEVLSGLDAMAGDRVALVTLGGPVRSVVMPPSGDIGSVGRLVEGLATTDSAADFEGLGPILDNVSPDDAQIVVLSGWRRGSVSTLQSSQSGASWRSDLGVLVSQPASASGSNISVASLEPPRSLLVSGGGGPADFANPARVTLVRSGEGVSRADVTRITAFLDSVGGTTSTNSIGEVIVRWSAGQTEAIATIALRADAITTGTSYGVLRVTIDGDAVAGDNSRQVPIELREQLRVAIIAPGRFGQAVGVQRFGAIDWVRLALAPSDDDERGLRLIEIDPGALDRPRVAGLDAAVVLRPDLVRADGWAVLRAMADRGGLVLVTAAAGETVQDWTDGFESAFETGWTIGREAMDLVDMPAIEEPGSRSGSVLGVLSGELSFLVDAVHVSRVLSVSGVSDVAVVLRLLSGEPLLVMSRPAEGRGVIAVLATAIDVDWTDLPLKPLMVPLMQELVRQGVAQGSAGIRLTAGGLFGQDGRTQQLTPVGGGRSVRVQAEGTPMRDAGVWRGLDEAGATVGLLAVNADHAAGDVTLGSADQVESAFRGFGLDNLGMLDATGANGSPSDGPANESLRRDGWSWVILLCAAVLAVIEMFMARVVSHAGHMFGADTGLGQTA